MPHKDPIVRRAYVNAWSAAKYQDPAWLQTRKEYLKRTADHRREIQRQYRLEHFAEIKARKAERKDQIRIVQRRYTEANRDKLRAQALKNRPRIRANYRKWAKVYYKQHPDKLWKNIHPERHRELSRQRHRVWLRNNRWRYQECQRARKARMRSNPDATAFYRFVRSQKTIPCYYCGTVVSGKTAHVDHVIALSKEGNHASSNLCASCSKCNLRKNNKMPSDLPFVDQPLLNL